MGSDLILLINYAANSKVNRFVDRVAHAANIKIKRNNFFEGFIGLSSAGASNEHSASAKNANYFAVNYFSICSHFCRECIAPKPSKKLLR